MAVIRELVTLFDFKVDPEGINKYEATVNKAKSLALSLAGAFGFVFAAERIYTLVDGLVDAGKEINKLTYQLTRMARPGDDINAAMQTLFNTAQATGVEYTHVLETYKEMLNESKELNVSQDQLTTTVDNLYKGLRLGAASPEQMAATFASIERSFRMGRFGRRQFGMLEQQAPEVIDALAASLGKTRHELAEMAKEGKLTSEVLINGLGKPIAKLNADFANRPRKLGEGFMYAWNAAAKLSAVLWKMYNVNSRVAAGIVWATDKITVALEYLSNAFGGLDRTIKTLGITLSLILGVRFIGLLDAAIAASLRLVLVWGLIGAAVAAVFLTVHDIMYWMSGKPGRSVMGDLLGPYADFQKKMQSFFQDSPFFAIIRSMQKLFTGDISGAFKELGTALGTIDGLLGTITASLVLVLAGFLFWNTLKFLSLITGLKFIATTAIPWVTNAAFDTAVGLGAWNKISFLPLLARLSIIGGAIYGVVEAAKWLDKQYPSPGEPGSQWKDWSEVPFTRKWWGKLLGTDNPADTVPGTVRPNVVPPPPNMVPPGVPSGGEMTVTAPRPVEQTVNQTNNVTITGVGDADIAKQAADAIRGTADAIARQLRSATPATEFPPS